MVIDAATFAGMDHKGRVIAFAVLCPAARYCSTISERGSAPVRRFITPEEWKQIEEQLAAGLRAQALSSNSPISCVLDDLLPVWGVRWLGTTPLTVARLEDMAAVLDQHLGSIGLSLASRTTDATFDSAYGR